MPSKKKKSVGNLLVGRSLFKVIEVGAEIFYNTEEVFVKVVDNLTSPPVNAFKTNSSNFFGYEVDVRVE